MWLIFPKTGGDALRSNMNKLCENVLSHLNKNSFFPILQTLLTKGLARAKPAFKKTQLVAIVTLALRMLQVRMRKRNLRGLEVLEIMLHFGVHFLQLPGILTDEFCPVFTPSSLVTDNSEVGEYVYHVSFARDVRAGFDTPS